MDFLDPLKRRRHRRRLIASYFLIALVLIAGTVVLMLITYGYGINPRTGTIVQNGLLFVESKPSAQITLNGAPRGSTSARLILPTQGYSLTLSRSGFRDWQRQFYIKEQTVLRLEYPILIPTKLAPKPIKNYDSLPPLVTASPDRHWLLVGGSVNAKGRTSLDLYDTNHASQNPLALNLPTGILTSPGDRGGQLSLVQWSSDNKHLLLEHKFDSGHEFIWFDRTAPAGTLNLNKQFGLNPDTIYMPQKANQLFVYTAKRGNLQLAAPTDTALSKPILSGVIDYTPISTNLLLYSKAKSKHSVTVHIWQDGNSYQLSEVPTNLHVLLGGTNYQGHSYYAVASTDGPWLSIYKDPLADLAKPSPGKIDALVSLKINDPHHLSVSPNSRIIEADNGKQITTIDLDSGLHYLYSLPLAAGFNPLWSDNFHLSTAPDNQLQLIDYDGANRYHLAISGYQGGGFLSNDYHQLWSFGQAAGNDSVSLEATSLIASQ